MSPEPPAGPDARPPGLRERKKARTRADIQRHALRLFREQGYDATTVDQIAEAAEISQTTFFRYFPSKEAVVLIDDYDEQVLAAFERQPPDRTPAQALRGALRDLFAEMRPEEFADARERQLLALTVPQLRAEALDGLAQIIHALAGSIATRTGRSGADLGVQAQSGALVGVMIAALLHWAASPEADIVAVLDVMLAAVDPESPPAAVDPESPPAAVDSESPPAAVDSESRPAAADTGSAAP